MTAIIKDPDLVRRVIALSTYMTYGQIVAEVSTTTRSITRNQVAGIVYRHARKDPVKTAAREAFLRAREAERASGAEARRQRDLERRRAYNEWQRAHRAAMRAKGLHVSDGSYQAERRERLAGLEGLEMRRIGFDDLQRRTCRWIDGSPTAEHFYCGNETVPGSSYCACHHAVAYSRVAREAPNPRNFIQKRTTTGVWR